MNRDEVGLLLYRSVHCPRDAEARSMRDLARVIGASPELIASAARLRGQRLAEDVTVVGHE